MRRVALAAFAATLTLSAAANNVAAAGNQKIGVVLMHGKWGGPSALSSIANQLRAAGILVLTPEMPWSRNRAYAKSYESSMTEIDASVKKLKSGGAARIYVGGLSMGANAALGYGARRGDISGLILLAPGHVPGMAGFDKRLAGSVAKAKKLAAAGKGDMKATFRDRNQGRMKDVTATPNVYLSWFSPGGPAVMATNAARLKPGLAVFCADGSNEPYPRCSYLRARIKGDSKSKFMSVPSGHRQVPHNARRQVVAWLMSL